MLIKAITTSAMLFITTNLYALTGIVVDSAGNGVAGTKIEVSHANGSSIVYSAAGGYFSVDAEIQGAAQVLVTHNGYEAKSINNVNPAVDLQISLNEKSFVLKGWVIDAQGLGVANVTIDAGALGQFATNGEGYFSINAKYGDYYQLSGHLVDFFLGEPVKGILEGDTERRLLAVWD